MWKYVKDSKPITYKIGNWDGETSDQVVAEDKNGKKYLATFCEGFLDGSKFAEWYDDREYFIEVEIVRWLEIID
jgi:hypothetical protein